MKRGTGKSGRLAKMPCAGKTGTTNDAKDLWFVGFTKYYTTGIWVGYDMPKSLNNLPLMATPLSIWKSYMEDIHTGLEIKALDAYKLPKKIEEKPEKTEKEPPEENPVEPPSDDTEITDDQIDTGETEDNTDDNDETDEGENRRKEMKIRMRMKRSGRTERTPTMIIKRSRKLRMRKM